MENIMWTLFYSILEEWKVSVITIGLFILYGNYYKKCNFFKSKGVDYVKPAVFFGNARTRVWEKKSVYDYVDELYNKYKRKPCVGTYEGGKPILYILDPEVIRAVTKTDFDHFMDKNTIDTFVPRSIERIVTRLKGSEWKDMRSAISPAFSPSRMKDMLPLLNKCTKQLVQFLKKNDNENMEMKQTMGHFTLEVIGACAFGIQSNSMTQENARFVKVTRNIGNIPNTHKFLLFLMSSFAPSTLKYFNLSRFNKQSLEELLQILRATRRERKLTGVKRNDFLQLLINASEQEKADSATTGHMIHLDEETIDAQCILFLLAGYDTTRTLLSLAIHILAIKPELQENLRQYIKMKMNGDEITYEIICQMEYVEGFLLETLRMYPPIVRFGRECTKQYILPGTKIPVKVGEAIAVPVYGIHMDPEIYPEPTEFKPERFIGEEKKNRPSHLYLPFGAGPRNCIGGRFAMFTAIAAVIALLTNFKFSICAKTCNPIKIDRKSAFIKVQGDSWVKIESLV